MTIGARTGMPETKIDREALQNRFFQTFYDPAFDNVKPELGRALELAWNSYEEGRKALKPRFPSYPGVDPRWSARHFR